MSKPAVPYTEIVEIADFARLREARAKELDDVGQGRRRSVLARGRARQEAKQRSRDRSGGHRACSAASGGAPSGDQPTQRTVLFVGEIEQHSQQQWTPQIELHELRLRVQPTGATVLATRKHFVGTGVAANGGAAIVACVVLPGSEDVLFAAPNLQSQPPLNGHPIGLLSKSTATVQPLAVTGLPNRRVNALCVDPTGTTAYVALAMANNLFDVYAFSLTTRGAIRVAANLATTVASLSIDAAGRRLTAAGFSTAGDLYTIDLGTKAVTSCSLPFYLNGVAEEDDTGRQAWVDGVSAVGWMTQCAAQSATLHATAGWGQGSGIALCPSLSTFGRRTPHVHDYGWSHRPNAGGLPTLGNNGFTLSVASATGQAPGVWWATLNPGSGQPILGLTLWVDPATLLLQGTVAMAQSANGWIGVIPLPLPNLPGLRWQRLHLQSFHLTGHAGQPFASTEGLDVRLQ